MKPLIAITMGDYNGVGPEIALKSVRSARVHRECRTLLVGSIDVFDATAQGLGLRLNFEEIDRAGMHWKLGNIPVVNTHPFAKPRLAPGRQTVHAGRWAGETITAAARLCIDGICDGMVTAPVSKKTMVNAGFKFPGQTEMIASLAGKKKATMMLVAGNFRVGLATVHIPLKSVSHHISRRLVMERLAAIDRTLKSDFRIRAPRIAVLGLNPHAGEYGLLGKEEIAVLGPAIKQSCRSGIRAEGPFPADGFFGMHMHTQFDAVLAMYHDQGLVPLKMSGFDTGVNYSSGLPIVRTSPDHGTAFGIAGRGIANPGSMIEAILLAVSITRNRARRQ